MDAELENITHNDLAKQRRNIFRTICQFALSALSAFGMGVWPYFRFFSLLLLLLFKSSSVRIIRKWSVQWVCEGGRKDAEWLNMGQKVETIHPFFITPRVKRAPSRHLTSDPDTQHHISTIRMRWWFFVQLSIQSFFFFEYTISVHVLYIYVVHAQILNLAGAIFHMTFNTSFFVAFVVVLRFYVAQLAQYK